MLSGFDSPPLSSGNALVSSIEAETDISTLIIEYYVIKVLRNFIEDLCICVDTQVRVFNIHSSKMCGDFKSNL